LGPISAGTSSDDERDIGARDGAEEAGNGWFVPGSEIRAAIAARGPPAGGTGQGPICAGACSDDEDRDGAGEASKMWVIPGTCTGSRSEDGDDDGGREGADGAGILWGLQVV